MLMGNYSQTLWGIVCIIMAGVIFSHKKFSFIDGAATAYREENLDGLRFLLASFVAFHHYIFSFEFFLKGTWTLTGHPLESFAGKFGVSIFFMLSGYLFVNVVEKNIDWFGFYIKRAARIFPMMTVSSLLCICIAIIIQRINGREFSLDGIIYWFDGGILNFRPNISGFNNTFLINGGFIKF
jgi:peptidoglycan/LPS O-acetylase OafA/YrhL